MPGVLAALAAVASVSAIALVVPAPGISPSTTPSPAVRPAVSTRAASLAPAGTAPLVARGTVETRRTTTAPRSRFRWPVDPPPHVLPRFEVGPQPWSSGHRRVDLAASAGQPVLAAGPGVVTFAGRIAGVGAVAVAHAGGIRTTYQPVTAAVRVGEHVRAGQVLGEVGDWPEHCAGPCLHWGALRGATYLDPLVLLGLVPPVLLPLSG